MFVYLFILETRKIHWNHDLLLNLYWTLGPVINWSRFCRKSYRRSSQSKNALVQAFEQLFPARARWFYSIFQDDGFIWQMISKHLL